MNASHKERYTVGFSPDTLGKSFFEVLIYSGIEKQTRETT